MHPGRLWKGTLLIAGTTIGGGILGLPVLTSLGGFLPAVVLYVLCWLFMMTTGLLTLEAYMWMEGDPNLITMAENTLGKWGKVYTWVLYLFLFFCLTLAYTVGCGNLLVAAFGGTIPHWLGATLFIAMFSPFIFAGARIVGRLNVPLMVGLLFFYATFVIIGMPYVQTENLMHLNWLKSMKALPITFAAFGFHGTVPTLCRYLERDYRHARIAIVVGSFIPLLAYLVWEWLILGIVPTFGPGGLAEAIEHGLSAVEPLKIITENPKIYLIGQCFAFFALVTSFLGVTLGLRDFLADGLGIEKTPMGRLVICSMIFVPVLFLSITYPGIFLEALDRAGGFGGALILGLLPIMMVWGGRYHHQFSKEHATPGGRPFLAFLAFLVFFEIGCEIWHLLGNL